MRFQNIFSTIANGFARTSVAGTEMLRYLLPVQDQPGTQKGRHLPAGLWLTRLTPLAGVLVTSGGPAVVHRPSAMPGTQGKPAAFAERFARIGKLVNAAISDVAGQSPRASHRTSLELSTTSTLITRCQQVQENLLGKS